MKDTTFLRTPNLTYLGNWQNESMHFSTVFIVCAKSKFLCFLIPKSFPRLDLVSVNSLLRTFPIRIPFRWPGLSERRISFVFPSKACYKYSDELRAPIGNTYLIFFCQKSSIFVHQSPGVSCLRGFRLTVYAWNISVWVFIDLNLWQWKSFCNNFQGRKRNWSAEVGYCQ